MKRFSTFLLALMLFYGCAIKPIPLNEAPINLETEGLLIFTQGETFFLPADPDCLFPPEFTEYKLIGITVHPLMRIDESYMKEIGAVAYGISLPSGMPIRCITGYSDDNYFIKHDSCYICYSTIKLIAFDKLRISYGLGNPILNYFTWNIILNGYPINCNILGSQWYFEVLNAEKVDRTQLHDYLNGVCPEPIEGSAQTE